MTVKAIHQFIPNIASRDAIGEFALALQVEFIRMGYDSQIFCETCSEDLKNRVIFFDYYSQLSSSENILIIHYGFKISVQKRILTLPDKKFLVYHNVTPEKFFKDFSSKTQQACRESREQVRCYKEHVELAIGVSDYNVQELKEMGFENTAVIPIFVEFDKYDLAPDPSVQAKIAGNDWKNWLFVGRVFPNKKQDDLIRVFDFYQKQINPKSRLILVGHWHGMELYYYYLREMVKHLDQKNVIFTGSVSQEALVAYYQNADLFMIMSEHEGFCVPILEAFYSGVPVIAFDSSAIRETMGGCGLLVNEKKFPEIGELANYIFENPAFQKTIVEKQKARIEKFSKTAVLKKWENLIDTMNLSA